MNSNKYIRVLSRVFRKKAFKLSMVGISLVGLLISSGHSFAKYRDENYGGGNAGAAKFGSWSITSSTVNVKFPDGAPTGYYAFIASFTVSFTEGEVAREYTLKVKGVDDSTTASEANFNAYDKTPSKIHYCLDSTKGFNATSKIYAIHNSAVIGTGNENVVGTLLGDTTKFQSFETDQVYLYSKENDSTGSWSKHSKNETYDATTNSIKLTENHPINALEADTHEYKLLFLINTTGVEKEDFGYKFIYSLDVRQVN